MPIAIANRFGVTHHLGAMIVTTVSSGRAVPPIGYCLFVGMANSKLPLGRNARAIRGWAAVRTLRTPVPGRW